jgi:hypothetical protein
MDVNVIAGGLIATGGLVGFVKKGSVPSLFVFL